MKTGTGTDGGHWLSVFTFSEMAGKKKKGKKQESKGEGEDTSAHSPSETRSGKQYQPHSNVDEDEQQGTRVPQSGPPIGKFPPLRTAASCYAVRKPPLPAWNPPSSPESSRIHPSPHLRLHASYCTRVMILRDTRIQTASGSTERDASMWKCAMLGTGTMTLKPRKAARMHMLG